MLLPKILHENKTSVMFLKGFSDKATFRLTSPDFQDHSCSTEISSYISTKNLCAYTVAFQQVQLHMKSHWAAFRNSSVKKISYSFRTCKEISRSVRKACEKNSQSGLLTHIRAKQTVWPMDCNAVLIHENSFHAAHHLCCSHLSRQVSLSMMQFTDSATLVEIVTFLRGDPTTSQSPLLQVTDAASCLVLVQ